MQMFEEHHGEPSLSLQCLSMYFAITQVFLLETV